MYIAHIRKDSDDVQSVEEHNQNTAKLAVDLCCIKDLKTTVRITALLHDVGKNTPEFMEYILRAKKDPSSVHRGEVVHSTAGAFLITEIAGKMIGIRSFCAEMVREAIISHHGLYDCVTPDGVILYDKRLEKELPIDDIRNEVFLSISKEEFERLFRMAVAEIDLLVDGTIAYVRNVHPNDIDVKFFYFGMSERLLLSLLIDADRTDTACFMNNKPYTNVSSDESIKLKWGDFLSTYDRKMLDYKEKCSIDKFRDVISLSCFEAAFKESGVYRLVVPTGAGKTLSSLRYALKHAEQFGKKHIFYVAPFNSIVEQNAYKIRETLDAEEAILEHHCNIVSEDDHYKELTENWDAPIVITSAVQFLNTLFSAKTSSVRRMHSLSNSVIILDEVQSIPVKCIGLFNLAVNYLSGICNSSIVLCSATQPLFDKLDKSNMVIPEDMVENSEKYFLPFKRTRIIDKTNDVPGGFSIEQLAGFILEASVTSKSMLVIVNTKSCARNLYLRLLEKIKDTDNENSPVFFHLSTNMCARHRQITLNLVRDILEKGKKVICVSTQLIEAGVDISFGTVIRSLAGLDSIVQAAGRCNRNYEDSNLGNVYIVRIKDEELSNLVDIKMAQDAMCSVLYKYHQCSELLDNDLLSKKAMDEYYAHYFMKRKNEMDYLVPELNSTIVDLLTKNSIGTHSLERKQKGQKSNLIFKQAFKTAGEQFEVITDKGMKDIVVDYDQVGAELISEMNSEISIARQIQLIKMLQVYTVSISDSMRKFLESQNALWTLKNGGVLALKKEYYSSQTGVSKEPTAMDPYFL